MKIILKKYIDKSLLNSDEVAIYIAKANLPYTQYHYNKVSNTLISKKILKYYLDEADITKTYICSEFLGDVVPVLGLGTAKIVDFEDLINNNLTKVRTEHILVDLVSSNIINSNTRIADIYDNCNYTILNDTYGEYLEIES